MSAKAIVVADGRILLVRHADGEGDWYSLPGGGQRHGETLPEAIERECFEETGLRVRIGPLLLVRDYIADNHEFADEDPGAHQVELMFQCDLVEGRAPRLGDAPDEMQTGAEWIELARLSELRLYPRTVARILAEGIPKGTARYLGDVN